MRALYARPPDTVAPRYDAGVPIYAGTDAGGFCRTGWWPQEIAALAAGSRPRGRWPPGPGPPATGSAARTAGGRRAGRPDRARRRPAPRPGRAALAALRHPARSSGRDRRVKVGSTRVGRARHAVICRPIGATSPRADRGTTLPWGCVVGWVRHEVRVLPRRSPPPAADHPRLRLRGAARGRTGRGCPRTPTTPRSPRSPCDTRHPGARRRAGQPGHLGVDHRPGRAEAGHRARPRVRRHEGRRGPDRRHPGPVGVHGDHLHGPRLRRLGWTHPPRQPGVRGPGRGSRGRRGGRSTGGGQGRWRSR